jgi:hypothetical protein
MILADERKEKGRDREDSFYVERARKAQAMISGAASEPYCESTRAGQCILYPLRYCKQKSAVPRVSRYCASAELYGDKRAYQMLDNHSRVHQNINQGSKIHCGILLRTFMFTGCPLRR